MKKIGCLSFMLVSCLSALQDRENFLEGVHAYQEGAYQRALSSFESVAHKGPATYLNSALCHFALGHCASAYAMLDKARDGASYREIKNLLAIKNRTDQSLFGTKKTDFWWTVETLSFIFPFLLLQLCFLLLLMIFAYLVFSRKRLRLLVVLGLALCFWGGCLAVRLRAQRMHYGYSTGSALLYVLPEKKLDTIAEIDACARVMILEMRDDWYKVRYTQRVGWVPASDVVA